MVSSSSIRSNSNGNCDDVASFFTKSDALFRKNLTFQKRNWKMNVGLVMFPFLLCLLMLMIQLVVNSQLDKPKYRCGCKCVQNGNGTCQNRCGVEFSATQQAAFACPIRTPQKWPALFQIPGPRHRAVQTASHSFAGLPHASCLETGSCPVTSLYTGQNRSSAQGLVREIVIDEFPRNLVDLQSLVSLIYLGTYRKPSLTNFVESAFSSKYPLHVILPSCIPNFSFMVPVTLGNVRFQQEITCVESSYLWRENSASINKELLQGYWRGNSVHEIHEILAAYDFLNSNEFNFNVSFWYNSTYCNVVTNPCLLRIPRSLNMVSNAFLRHFKDGGMRIHLDFVKEMPRAGSRVALNLSSSIGPLLFAWVIQLLFPVFLTCLVYDKQHKLRIMMKMHGLGDGPYWLVSYIYFFLISSIYMIWFAVMGSVVGLEIFLLNNYTIQLVFYFVYLNLQVAFTFLAATVFSDVKTATVLGYIYVFGSGLLGTFLFQNYVEDTTFSRSWLMTMELVPGFSLYRGLYELSQYALAGHYTGTSGMTWEDLNDQGNGMKETLVIMTLEWLIFLVASYYLDQVVSSGNGVSRDPLFFLGNFQKKHNRSFKISSRRQRSIVFVDLENPDISEERLEVEKILDQQGKQHPIVCHNLNKVYSGRDSKKHAVENLSLAVPFGECFGLLGPNGAGKTTLIKMLTGFLQPTSGTAFIDGLDIISDMDKIYKKIGVCPQHDLIWENLTGREHLLFYGRVRNLKGELLQQVVDDSLKSLNLYQGNVGDQLAGKYSGGMKRRLSVGISLIGDTQVVFMDEPTTGLDPESRNNLWHVVKMAKTNRAIILTTHSMEEADFLCDRLGIMVGGNLKCVGSSKELKTRYGGSYVLTISANPAHEDNVDSIVNGLSSNAVKIYNVGGTQKFRMPKKDVRIFEIFNAIENFKKQTSIKAFGLADASLEDVFTNVVHGASDQNLPD
ncbi:hypothetical protein AAC387_Pa09g1870 [Persea americana]